MAVEPETWLDGLSVSADTAALIGANAYGAFTTFRVERGGVRGLDLHMDRLCASSRALFGLAPDAAVLRGQLAHCLAGRQEGWVRMALVSKAISPRAPDVQVVPNVMISVAQPVAGLIDGQRMTVIPHQRYLPEIKSLATMPLIHARRQARMAGFDDAVFADGEGRLTEGTLWNIGFVRGDTVVWPRGEKLDGVTQRLIMAGLARAGIQQAREDVRSSDLVHMDAAFLCNASTPCAAIESIDGYVFGGAESVLGQVREAWHDNPPQSISA